MKKIQLIVIAFFWLISANAFATQSNSGIVWSTAPDTALILQFSATRCPAATGVQTLTATVYGSPSNSLISNADVNAIVQYPDTTTADINFTNNGNGTYTNDFNFTQTGTYQFDINATRASTTSASRREYIYVQSFNINISFVNNNAQLTAGTTGTIRNNATNDDGNAFVDINGLTTIFYPNGNTFVSNGSMTDLGTGEYTYAFTVPTTSGTYSATSTFSCGSESDSNSAGRFSVPTSGSSGSGSSSSEGAGGGGASGGGTGSPISGKITSIDLDELQIGKASKIRIKVLNLSRIKTSFYVEVKINQGTISEYNETMLASQIAKDEEKEIEFVSKFTPTIAGSHVVTARLLSINKQKEFDKLTKVFDIVGEIRYDVGVVCLSPHALIGTQTDAQILMKNLGNYYEDVFLSWWVEDSKGSLIGLAELPLALNTGEEKTLEKSIALPLNLPIGNYFIKAKMQYRDQARIGSCSFVIERAPEYYARMLEELKIQAEELEKSIEELKSQGFDTQLLEQKLAEINDLLNEISLSLNEQNFEGIEEHFEKLKLLLHIADNELNSFGVQAAIPLLSQDLVILITAITLIFGTGALLLGGNSGGLLGFKEEGLAESLLGFKK
ncbi:MAG: hypothetical protein Q7S21_01735 [archaeon]|nr:hypothetical protein [archaeon]